MFRKCREHVLAWVTAAGSSGQWRGQSGQLVHWVRRCSDREAEDFKPRRAQYWFCVCEHLHLQDDTLWKSLNWTKKKTEIKHLKGRSDCMIWYIHIFSFLNRYFRYILPIWRCKRGRYICAILSEALLIFGPCRDRHRNRLEPWALCCSHSTDMIVVFH